MKWYLNYKHSQELLIHLLAWVFLFCLPPMLIGRANERPGQEELFRMMGPPLAMAMVFYLNYIWLVPQLLFNKRNKAYVLSNVAFCIGMLFFTHLWFELVNAYFHSTPPPPKNSMGFWGFLLFRLRDFILFGLIAALAATIRMSKKWHEAELGRQKAELKRIEAELKSELEATKGKTGYKIVEVEKEVAADSLLQVITRPYRGKMVLVDMWNTWCGPCMRAMKSLKPLKEELKEVVYLYIVDETSPEGKWKVMIPDIPGIHCRISNEQSTALAKLYEYPGIPTYFDVNREGDISYKATGFPGVEMLRNELTK